MKLTPAQKREYEFLKKNGSKYVSSWSLRRVYDNLVKLGLAETDGSWNWFHLKNKL